MFDDKQGGQNLNQGQGGVKMAPPTRLPTGSGSTPRSGMPTLPAGEATATEDILDGVDNSPTPSPLSGPVTSGPQMPSPFVLKEQTQAQPVQPPTSPSPPASLTDNIPVGQVSGDIPPAGPSLGVGASQPPVQAMPPEHQPEADPALGGAGMMNGVDGKKLSSGKKIFIIILTVVIVAALASLGYWLYDKLTEGDAGEELMPFEIYDKEMMEPEPEEEMMPPAGMEEHEEGNEQRGDKDLDESEEFIPVPPVQPELPIDTDGDGLTDEEESVLGTNEKEPDSDWDGLSDRDEVEIYQTDPWNPDTDGDGYLDGDEVEHGYDPKGPGRLLEVP